MLQRSRLDLTCLVVTSPCWLVATIVVTLWIKVASPGPIFYRQVRVGYRGRHFTILKFRSMVANVETHSHEQHLVRLMNADCPMRKLDSSGDPRLIPGGRILRALGLDELPQIVNVIRGEMSLVGPRPCTPHEFEHYKPWQRQRVNAPPGLTGLWQVSGKNRTTFNEMIKLDLLYRRKMSPWMDLVIILKTVPALLVQAADGRRGLNVIRLPDNGVVARETT